MACLDALADVLASSRGWPLPAAARELTRAGVPVFPCVPGGKHPLSEHGFLDASIDPDRVQAWWRRHPGANIGVPTGAASGLVVVDVDVHGLVDGHEAFQRCERAGLVAGWLLLASTPSGGMHAYYPATPGQAQRCWQAASAGIDFRGDGGYILVPPSKVSQAGTAVTYRLRRLNPGPAQCLDSQRLRHFLDPRPTPWPVQRPVAQGQDGFGLASWVASRRKGERNRGLFWAACRLAENDVPAGEALNVLGPAAAGIGLDAREINATIRSAYRTARGQKPVSRPSARDASTPRPDGCLRGEGTVARPSRTREL